MCNLFRSVNIACWNTCCCGNICNYNMQLYTNTYMYIVHKVFDMIGENHCNTNGNSCQQYYYIEYIYIPFSNKVTFELIENNRPIDTKNICIIMTS